MKKQKNIYPQLFKKGFMYLFQDGEAETELSEVYATNDFGKLCYDNLNENTIEFYMMGNDEIIKSVITEEMEYC